MISIPGPRESVVSSAAGPFFVQRATERNISNNWTVIDNALTNGDPDAMLLVTPNWNPGGSAGGVYNDHPVGVWYTEGHWAIFNQDRAPMPVGAAFNVLVINRLAAPAAEATSPAGGDVRIVQANGTVEIRHPDGSKTFLSEGGIRKVSPDGRETAYYSSQVQPVFPAALPDEQDVVVWLQGHNASLLDLISNVASDGQASVDNYLKNEGAGLSLYQQVERRRRFVERMLAN